MTILLRSQIAPAPPLAGEAASAAAPAVGAPRADSPDGVLNTVGLAVLAFGLVQLLSRVLDRLPLHRAAGDARAAAPSPALGDEDRRRIERAAEAIGAVRDRGERLAEQLATQQRLTGRALDELRRLRRQNEAVLRRLRALHRRLGRPGAAA